MDAEIEVSLSNVMCQGQDFQDSLKYASKLKSLHNFHLLRNLKIEIKEGYNVSVKM